LEQLVELLKAHGVTCLVDIRTIPKSRRNPQLNLESLDFELPKFGMKYKHMKELGGLRQAAIDTINTAWQNPSFRGFADYMQTDEFSNALYWLMDLATAELVAIMCAEGNPYRCHRILVADALTVRKIEVCHISSPATTSLHHLTPFAEVDGTNLTYPGIL
jgi:uncharacterized protein (DUF488 family)